MRENIYSKLQHLSDIYHFTASWPFSNVTVNLWAEHFPFVAYVMWMTTRLYFRSIHKCCSRTDRRYDRLLYMKQVLCFYMSVPFTNCILRTDLVVSY